MKASDKVLQAACYVAWKPADLWCQNFGDKGPGSLPEFIFAAAITTVVTLPVTVPMCVGAALLKKVGW